ncbi:MAG TPA: magnesium transporter CorA family protein [Ktedonobacteraceae bacterium]
MPIENAATKDQKKRFLTRLSRLSVRYRKTKAHTTLAGGSEQEFTPETSTLTKDVMTFEMAPTPETAAAQRTMVLGSVFRARTLPRNIEVVDIVETLNDAENYLWIDLANYVPEDLQTLAQGLQIHPIALQVALSGWKSPRLDVFREHFFVTATLPSLQSKPYRVQAHQINLFVGKNFLLSAHQVALPFTERALTRCALHTEHEQIDSAFLLYILLDELLTYYEDLNVLIQEQIEQMEERALIDTSDGFLKDLLHFKRYAFALAQLADQHRAIFAVFLRPDFHYIPEQEIVLYYRDLEARLSRLIDLLRAAKESVNGIFDIYVSHVSHHTNNVIKILTMVSTILLPSTLIFTFFSTDNIQDIPLFTHQLGFILMVISVLCISALILWQFRKKGWL